MAVTESQKVAEETLEIAGHQVPKSVTWGGGISFTGDFVRTSDKLALCAAGLFRTRQPTGATRMDFMVTFALTHRDYKERVSRFLQTGAPPPAGVTLHGRWFTASHSRGFMLVETDDPTALFRWTSEWADLIDFQIEPVVGDAEAGKILKDLT